MSESPGRNEGERGGDPLIVVNLEAGQSYWFELGTWRPDLPWAPPPNSPYFFRVSFEEEPPGPAGSLDVQAGPEHQLQIGKAPLGLALSWGDSCIVEDTDYAIYQGQLDVMGEHAPIACSTGGANRYFAEVPPGNAYFLVAAQNGFVSGSYGVKSDGGQRPRGSPACLLRFFTQCP